MSARTRLSDADLLRRLRSHPGLGVLKTFLRLDLDIANSPRAGVDPVKYDEAASVIKLALDLFDGDAAGSNVVPWDDEGVAYNGREVR